MKADLVVANGVVCTPDGLLRVGIAVKEGRIIAVAPEVALPEAERVIDATGKVVIPGFIDAHVHTRDPGYTYKEDFETATRCAAFGGVTMIVDMPNVKPPVITAEIFEQKRSMCKQKAIVDFNHWASPFRVKEIPKIAELGAAGYKMFMKYAGYPYDTEASNTDQGLIYEAFKTVAKTGRPCIVHPHNQYIYDYNIKKCKEAGITDFATFWWKTTAPEVGESVIPLLIYLAGRAGMKLGLLHCKTKESVAFVKYARAKGQEVFAECNPWHLWPAEEGSPAYGRWLPNLLTDIPLERASEASQMAWENLLSDDFLEYGYVSSDHSPHLEEECFPQDPVLSHAGFGDLTDFYLSRFLTEVNRGKITLQRVVKLCSENVAKLTGVYPRKGTIQIGADADLAIVDMTKKYAITKEMIHSKCGWSLWEGAEVEGAPVYTIVRGKVVMENGKVIGEPGYGEFVAPIRQ